jgi:hypothetical protein
MGALSFTPDGATLAMFDAHQGRIRMLNLRQLRTELAKVGLDW